MGIGDGGEEGKKKVRCKGGVEGEEYRGREEQYAGERAENKKQPSKQTY